MDKIDDLIRTEESDQEIIIEAICINWNGPHELIEKWDVVKKIPKNTDKKQIQEAISQVFNNQKYFRNCNECKKTVPIGYMHDKVICQACAPNKYGIVY